MTRERRSRTALIAYSIHTLIQIIKYNFKVKMKFDKKILENNACKKLKYKVIYKLLTNYTLSSSA